MVPSPVQVPGPQVRVPPSAVGPVMAGATVLAGAWTCTAPMSQAAVLVGRGSPRSSAARRAEDVGSIHAPPAAITGLVLAGNIVWVGPPLGASAASCGSARRSPAPGEPPSPLAYDSRLCPFPGRAPIA